MSQASGVGRSEKSWVDLARGAAQCGLGAEPVGVLREFLTFCLGGDAYAIPVDRVREIVGVRTVTPVPRVPSEVLGVISLRGEMVQVVDLRARLGLAPAEPQRSTRIVVVHSEGGQVTGLLVDAVTEVMRVSEDAVGTLPVEDSGSGVVGLCIRDEKFVSVLDIDEVLDLAGSD